MFENVLIFIFKGEKYFCVHLIMAQKTRRSVLKKRVCSVPLLFNFNSIITNLDFNLQV